MEINNKTLLLNQNYEPIRVISWKKAVSMFFMDKCEIISEYSTLLRSQKLSMGVPAVVKLNRYHVNLGKIKIQRKYVYARDDFTCQYCGRRFLDFKKLTYDHVIPKSRKGKTNWNNIVTCCKDCNHYKNDLTPEEAGMRLLRKPRTPTWFPALILKALAPHEIPPQWNSWLSYLRVN